MILVFKTKYVNIIYIITWFFLGFSLYLLFILCILEFFETRVNTLTFKILGYYKRSLC